MPDVLAVSAPPSPPSPQKASQKVEKSGTEKSAGDAPGKAEEREFAEVLDEAAEAPPAEAANLDPAAAMAAVQPPVTAVDEAVANGGALGAGGLPLRESRLSAAVQALRPEARAALQSASQEATEDPELAAPGDDTLARPGDELRRFDARATPGKPFDLALGKSETEPVTDLEPRAVTSAPPGAADAVAEASRRERPPVLRLDTHLPVHSPRFAEGFNQQVVVLAQHGIQQAQLSLSPPELGPIDVRITVAHDQASVQIAASSGVAREAIQEALPKLKEMMEESGVRLNDANVFAQLPQRDPQAGAQQRADWWQQHGNGAAPAESAELPAPVTIRALGLVDAYA